MLIVFARWGEFAGIGKDLSISANGSQMMTLGKSPRISLIIVGDSLVQWNMTRNQFRDCGKTTDGNSLDPAFLTSLHCVGWLVSLRSASKR